MRPILYLINKIIRPTIPKYKVGQTIINFGTSLISSRYIYAYKMDFMEKAKADLTQIHNILLKQCHVRWCSKLISPSACPDDDFFCSFFLNDRTALIWEIASQFDWAQHNIKNFREELWKHRVSMNESAANVVWLVNETNSIIRHYNRVISLITVFLRHNRNDPLVAYIGEGQNIMVLYKRMLDTIFSAVRQGEEIELFDSIK